MSIWPLIYYLTNIYYFFRKKKANIHLFQKIHLLPHDIVHLLQLWRFTNLDIQIIFNTQQQHHKLFCGFGSPNQSGHSVKNKLNIHITLTFISLINVKNKSRTVVLVFSRSHRTTSHYFPSALLQYSFQVSLAQCLLLKVCASFSIDLRIWFCIFDMRFSVRFLDFENPKLPKP